jgi:serine/threonine protein phosphatase PrpC
MGAWNTLNCSVAGASHIRKNKDCQDYSLSLVPENREIPVILSVSDGHGGSRYVRSAQGAVFACETAVSVASGYAHKVFEKAAKNDANLVKQLAEARLKADIVRKWQFAVLEDIKKRPFDESELEKLSLTPEEFEASLLSEDISDKEKLLAAYGATLLLVIILKDVIICEQIGDGDILFLDKEGKASYPLSKDESLIANETTSLCSLKAPFYFRHSLSYLYDKANIPKLIMLATDGYANSFSSEDDFLKTPFDYYNLLKKEGADFVSSNLENWLSETSAEGSGDDITISLAWRDENG